MWSSRRVVISPSCMEGLLRQKQQYVHKHSPNRNIASAAPPIPITFESSSHHIAFSPVSVGSVSGVATGSSSTSI